jgi:hypothetical protein
VTKVYQFTLRIRARVRLLVLGRLVVGGSCAVYENTSVIKGVNHENSHSARRAASRMLHLAALCVRTNRLQIVSRKQVCPDMAVFAHGQYGLASAPGRFGNGATGSGAAIV